MPGGIIRTQGDIIDPYMRPRSKRAAASIPSKFETTLNVGQRERDAFGGRTVRFEGSVSGLVGDTPGPGSYRCPSSMVRSSETCGSVSALGYGVGFVSKSGRFGPDRDARVAAALPGPGQYNAELSRSSWFSRAGMSAAFAPVRRFRDGDAGVTPGPASYAPEASRILSAPRAGGAVSAFRSGVQRGSYAPVSSAGPAPGTYDVTRVPGATASVERSAVFRSRCERGRELYSSACAMAQPGPGAYEVTSPGGSRATVRDMFGSTGLDRFGRPVLRRTVDDSVPGPGAYDADVVRLIEKVGVSQGNSEEGTR